MLEGLTFIWRKHPGYLAKKLQGCRMYLFLFNWLSKYFGQNLIQLFRKMQLSFLLKVRASDQETPDQYLVTKTVICSFVTI